MNKNQTVQSVSNACNLRLSGFEKHVGSKAVIAVNGEQMKLSQVIAVYKEALDAQAKVNSLRSELKAALGDRTEATASFENVDQAVKAYVENQFGIGSQQAREFGFFPRKVGKKSADTIAKAVAKAKATRDGAPRSETGAEAPGGGSSTSPAT